jgi:hypothetical protein
MDWMTWYNGLHKPSWTPSPATIGPIWAILCPIIFISFGFVFVQMLRSKIGWRMATGLKCLTVAKPTRTNQTLQNQQKQAIGAKDWGRLPEYKVEVT